MVDISFNVDIWWWRSVVFTTVLLDLNFLVVEFFCFLVLLYAVSNYALTSFCVLDLKLLVGVG
jgi:hypothetical protein